VGFLAEHYEETILSPTDKTVIKAKYDETSTVTVPTLQTNRDISEDKYVGLDYNPKNNYFEKKALQIS